MAHKRPDGKEAGAAIVLAVGLLAYLALTLGFVCGICLLGVHVLLIVAAVLLAMSALALRTLSAGLRMAGAAILLVTVVAPWVLYLNGVFDHVGGLTVPTGMTIGATVALLGRMANPMRVGMLIAGSAGVSGLYLRSVGVTPGFAVHQMSLVALAVLLLIFGFAHLDRQRGGSAPRAP